MKEQTSIQIFTALILPLFGLFFSGCDKCDKAKTTAVPKLTDKEKSIIPNEFGDTLYFKDNLGNTFYLACTLKELRPDGYYSLGHNNPCDDWSYTWDKLIAEFTGSLVTDQGNNINITTSISGGLNGGESSIYPPATNCTRPTASRHFIFWVHRQVFYGFTDDNNFPRIQNFNFRPNIKLEGKLFQNINYNSITPNSETNCPAPPNSNPGIDSVYYSTQYGIIRLTTVSDKKYQRVL